MYFIYADLRPPKYGHKICTMESSFQIVLQNLTGVTLKFGNQISFIGKTEKKKFSFPVIQVI